MEITEIRVKLTDDQSERLKAFCSVTLDGDFVIRDLKVIEGTNGYFVAMPSRKLADRCPKCGAKNHLRARFCNDCGARLNEERAPKDENGRAKLHADIAHPINAHCREEMQTRIIDAFEEEKLKAKQPGYTPPRLYDDDDIENLEQPAAARPMRNMRPAPSVPAAAARRDEPPPPVRRDEPPRPFGAGVVG